MAAPVLPRYRPTPEESQRAAERLHWSGRVVALLREAHECAAAGDDVFRTEMAMYPLHQEVPHA